MLIMFVAILAEFTLMAIKVEVRSVEPPLPAPVEIAAEFVLTPTEFMLIPIEFVLTPAELVEILAVAVLRPAEFVAMLTMLVDTPAESVPMLIMFAVILSEFAPIAMTTDVKSVEPPPPAPFAIAAEFVLIFAAFD